ncbi:hypothetical protein MTO98_16075 [Mucilaginibacter sp. SMC90]|uniref:hypothetical protein n=1 Tax=Mucilaginibacter sp. SMC90 TaxID=2929803 RepID=UPI001FB2E121|nr:hypothetical protein [Mucilaginibacter sp. SMC90]UOE52595.1 hypothetical protein MTO98_16075 [Mucilaginibacter sp. SMC90]
MNEYLTKLGVPPKVQAFFALGEPVFYFGDEVEYFSEAVHYIPPTHNLWMAGSFFARQIILTFSAMEAVSFLTLNQADYLDFDDLLFLSFGVRISADQLNWVRSNLRGREFTLAFGNDLMGRLADIKAATAIRNRMVRLSYHEGNVTAWLKEKKICFEGEKLSLSSFEKAFGIRTRIRTCKPPSQLTFLDQLKYDTPR